MKKNQLYYIGVLILLFQLSALFAFGQDGFITIKTGNSSTIVNCTGYTYTMKAAANIGSQSSGAGNVVIQKAVDNKTLTLQQIFITGENLTTVTLSVPKTDPTGRPSGDQSPQIITMSNVNISQITHYGGTSVPGKASGLVEEVTFVAQKIDFGASGAPAATTTVPAATKIKTNYDIKENKKN